MNRMLRITMLSILATGLAACASTGHNIARAPSSQPAPGSIGNDSEYMGRVEQIARRRGIEVQWVNPPSKRVASR
ncbi:MAG: hypothetical protein KIS72_03920 [Luteimonas sp.]|nr:hypothetical protein [Luteimonas sp.]